jgi:hypothetical protein
MKNKNRWLKIFVLGGVVFILAAGLFWRAYSTKNRMMKTVSDLTPVESPLYEAHDRPTTVFLRAVDMGTGHPVNIPAVIRESKSRLNQLKQAVLAYFNGPRKGKAQVPVPPGLTLNEVYWTPDNTVVVDVSVSRLKPEEMGFWEEALFVRGLIDSVVKNFYEIRQVKLLVEGQDTSTLAGHYALGTAESSMTPKPGPVPGNSK